MIFHETYHSVYTVQQFVARSRARNLLAIGLISLTPGYYNRYTRAALLAHSASTTGRESGASFVRVVCNHVTPLIKSRATADGDDLISIFTHTHTHNGSIDDCRICCIFVPTAEINCITQNTDTLGHDTGALNAAVSKSSKRQKSRARQKPNWAHSMGP